MSAAPAHTAKDRKRIYDLSGFVVLGEDAQPPASPQRPRGMLKSEAKVWADRIALPSPRSAKVHKDMLGCGTVLVQLPPSAEVADPISAPEVAPARAAEPLAAPAAGVATSSTARSYPPVTPADKAARYMETLSIKDPRELRAHLEASHFSFGGPVARGAAGASAAAAGLVAAHTRSAVPVTVPTERVPSHMQSERAFRHLRSTVDVLHSEPSAAAGRRPSAPAAAAALPVEACRPSRDVAVAMKADLLRSHFSLSHGH